MIHAPRGELARSDPGTLIVCRLSSAHPRWTGIPRVAVGESSRHLVDARLMQDAGPPLVVPGAPVAAPPHAFARWTTPDGAERSGPARTEPYQRAGTVVTIWVDDAGRPVRAPATRDEAATRAMLLVAPAGAGCAAAIGLIARLTLAADGRRRYAAIEREWAQVEPEWTRRRR